MARCEIHCPGGSAGAASAAVIAVGAAVFAVAVFVAEYAAIILPGLAGVGVVTFALYRAALRLTVRAWRPQHSPPAIGRAVVPAAIERRSAPLAIEAPRPVVYRITDVQQNPVEGRE